MNPQSSSTFSQEPNLESAMVVKFCSQLMIDRFRMSQSTMNLARQDSGEVSNKAENVKRTKIQKRLKIGQHKTWPILGLKVLLRKCKMFLGQGIHCLTKALFCAYLQNNLHKWTRTFATSPLLLPKIAMCIQLQNLELVQLSFTIWPQQWLYHPATIEERALCIYCFRVVLRFCRQLFSSVKYFCGFLQLFTSFQ